MKRRTFAVRLIIDGETVSEGVAYAMNSAIRKSEELIRTYARETGEVFEGAPPARIENTYSRVWLSPSGVVASVIAAEVAEWIA